MRRSAEMKTRAEIMRKNAAIMRKVCVIFQGKNKGRMVKKIDPNVEKYPPPLFGI